MAIVNCFAQAPRQPGIVLAVTQVLGMGTMTDGRKQAVTGLVPPELGETTIRVVWPSVATAPAVASLGRALMRTIVLAPLAWLLLAPFYFKKILPGLACRYTLTNRRLMIQKGWKRKPSQEIALTAIDDVRLQPDSYDSFYRTANLEVISKGQVAMTLFAVPNAESFRHAIVNAYKAWVPGKADTGHFVPASASKPA
jgi:hypothetical protein